MRILNAPVQHLQLVRGQAAASVRVATPNHSYTGIYASVSDNLPLCRRTWHQDCFWKFSAEALPCESKCRSYLDQQNRHFYLPYQTLMRNHVLRRPLSTEVLALREARQHLGVDCAEIAHRLKISKATVSSVLTGAVRGGASYEAVRGFLLRGSAKAVSTPGNL